jgi:hypothetical protein
LGDLFPYLIIILERVKVFHFVCIVTFLDR